MHKKGTKKPRIMWGTTLHYLPQHSLLQNRIGFCNWRENNANQLILNPFWLSKFCCFLLRWSFSFACSFILFWILNHLWLPSLPQWFHESEGKLQSPSIVYLVLQLFINTMWIIFAIFGGSTFAWWWGSILIATVVTEKWREPFLICQVRHDWLSSFQFLVKSLIILSM